MMHLISNERIRTRLRGVIEYIGGNIGTRPRLEKLADLAGMSTFHFLRVYSQHMGETPMATGRRLRLGRAWTMLAAGQRVGDVALATGYGSSQAFSHAFLRRYGIPPSHIPTGTGLLALPARIEWIMPRAVATIPFSDNLEGAVQVFDELFTLVHKTGARIATSQIYCVVKDASYMARELSYSGLACVVSDRPIRGLDYSILPAGAFAVMRMISAWPEVSESDAVSVERALEQIRYERIEGPLLARPVIDPYRAAPHERLWEILFPVHKIDH